MDFLISCDRTGQQLRGLFDVALCMALGLLSVPVIMNMLSASQLMNTSFDALRIVNSYGAFGRYQILIMHALQQHDSFI